MLRKILIIVLASFFVAYIFRLSDPVNELTAFIIGGEIPGTTITLSWLPTIGCAFVFLLGISKGVGTLRHTMHIRTTKLLKRQKKQAYQKISENDQRQRNHSVIASPYTTVRS